MHHCPNIDDEDWIQADLRMVFTFLQHGLNNLYKFRCVVLELTGLQCALIAAQGCVREKSSCRMKQHVMWPKIVGG